MREICDQGQFVWVTWADFSADLGASSNYSNEIFEDRVDKGSTWRLIRGGLDVPKELRKWNERAQFQRAVIQKGNCLRLQFHENNGEWQRFQSRQR